MRFMHILGNVSCIIVILYKQVSIIELVLLCVFYITHNI